MVRNSIILKSISHLFLVVLVYMHVCSAWCALSSGGDCCKQDKVSCHKSCCSGKKGSGDKGCQDFHLSFFKAAGQFSSEKSVDSAKDFPVVAAEIPDYLLTSFTQSHENLFAFSNYHPPPPLEDIRVYIRSFQI